jgi:hypothetical protein
MQGLDPSSGTYALPWWTLIAIVVLIAVLSVLAGVRGGWQKTIGSLAQFAAVIGILFLAWNFSDRMTARDIADERRAFQARFADLNARVLASSSPLACLDALAGDAFDEPCEKAIFANPESAAAAVSLMAARITLLREGIAHVAAGDTSYEHAVADLRRSLEQDRFGFVAQALVTGEQCSSDACEALSLLKDPSRVAANLKDRTFEIFVGRYVAAWMSRPAMPAVAAAPAQPAAPAAAPTAQAAVTPAASAVNVEFPSAASIPPVSIMNNEPGMTGQGGADTDSKPAAASRRPAPAAAPAPRAASRGGNAGPSTSAQ